MSSSPLDMSNPGDVFLSYTFHYRPSTVGNVVELVQFCLVTIAIFSLNIFWTRKTGNSATYMHLVTVTGIMESVGYYLRIQTTLSLSLTSFIITTCLILIAPIFLAGTNYVVIGKILKASDKSILCIKPAHATCFFLTADILCFFIQCSSAALLTSKDVTLQHAGTSVVLFGLGLQLFFYTCFCAITLYLAYSKTFQMMKNPGLRSVFIGMFLTSICLYFRNVYRLIEYAAGSSSPIEKSELTFFMCETTPILTAFVFYCLYHFGGLLPSDADLPLVIAKGPQTQAETKDEMAAAGVEMQQV